jgi:hypothetical protein
MNNIISCDLSLFGYRELGEAAELLKAYADHGAEFLGDGITLNFNTYSGYVFLSDEDYNVGMLGEDGKIHQWFSCLECGTEGFAEDGEFEKYDGYCSKYCYDKNK